MSKMNQAVKAKWVAALRSGEYKQTTEGMRIGDGFCCLGVLADVCRRRNEDFDILEDEDESLPSDLLVRRAGLVLKNPTVAIDGRIATLSAHNDYYGATFAEIADAIESQL